MLRLFFHFDGQILKVRRAEEAEVFSYSIRWKNRIEFALSETTVLMMSWTSFLPDLAPEEAQALIDFASSRYPVSFDYEELSRLCPHLVVGSDDEEWVFFGGTFNPWHVGHQSCLDLLPKEKLCFVIPDHSPHKELREFAPIPKLIEFSYKIKFGKKHFLVPTFLMDVRPNPTVDWVQRLSEKFPEKKISLLMGFDSLKNLKTWTRVEDLLPKLSTIYVVSRLEKDVEQLVVMEELKAMAPQVEIKLLGHHEHEGVSSTGLRK